MFNWKCDKRFSFILANDSGDAIPVKDWHLYKNEFLAEYTLIQELIENGFAEISDTFVDIEIDDVLKLDALDKQILGLPSEYPFYIYIESNGTLNQNSFKFKYGFYDFVPNGNRLVFRRVGAILESEGVSYLLSQSQFKVLEAMDSFNQLEDSQRTFSSNLSRFSDIKNFSKDDAATLDSYLANQDVISSDKIKIDISYLNNVLELTPKIDGLDQASLNRAFDISTKIKSPYNVKGDDGLTKRVTFNPNQTQQLEILKSKRRVIDLKEVEDIIENPENIFDDDIIDLADFSSRVREIGIYKPKFYPFICPYKTEWIPGFVIKDKVLGEKKIHFKTPVDLALFEKEKINAEQESRSSFEFQNEIITVEDANQIIRVAKIQFENPKEPIVKSTSLDSNEVLIIKENAELLEYIENPQSPESIGHVFYNVDNLVHGVNLKNHQIEGISWLQSLYSDGLNGCLLADDMGLGKTLQLLYFIEWHAQNTQDNKPYLIVAPVVILENWQNEYSKFFKSGSLEINVVYGSTGIEKKYSRNTVQGLQKKQIILTNYESLRIAQMNFCAVNYAVAALDEAQKIKTPGTQITNVAKAIKADFKIAMTGTPVENSLVDIWCIMDFSVPGLLGNAKDFAKVYQKPLAQEGTDVQALGEKLRGQIGVFIKRRLKQDVADDLPSKRTKVIKKVMPEKQVNRYLVEIELAQNSESTDSDGMNQALKSLWAIRDISDHPFLVDNQIHLYKTDELIASSAKLQVLIEVIEEIKTKGEKVIIFADRRDTQKLLQKVVYERLNIGPPSIINGDTPSSQQKETSARLSRQQTIDRFQSDKGFNVIIMSQLAAGVGLNVVGANHVIHFSRHWNPAKEDQATDRAYRIGQTKDVTVYYPMAVFPESFRGPNGEVLNSFDEVLDVRLANKKALAVGSLFPTEQSEVKVKDMYGDLFGNGSQSSHSTSITIEEVGKLNPRLFEAFTAVLFQKMGYTVDLTPFANDKGADVVAQRTEKNLIIQAKQSTSKLKNDAIQEIVTARKYYSTIYNIIFDLAVITNCYLGESALLLAESNQVQIFDRNRLIELLDEYEITILDINSAEAQRLTKI